MKKLLLCIPLFLLSACSGISDNTNGSKTKLFVYLDYSEVSTQDFRFRVSDVSASSYGSENYNFYISVAVKNLSLETKEVVFNDPMLIRESNNTSYKVNISYNKRSLDSEIEGVFSFSSTIPSSLDDHYCFSACLGDIEYKVYLYETPDELREDLTVTYKIDGSTVHTETVKKGRLLSVSYVYDAKDHQSYASIWKDSSGNEYSERTKIEDNVTLTGTTQSNLKLMTTSSDTYVFINGINHVHADGKVVVQKKYQNKEVCLGNYAIYNNIDVVEVYLPITLQSIYNGNFSNCGNLETIYFAGTKAQWEAIPKYNVTIPSTVSIVYGTSFVY